jgi:hypothetical protein
MGLARNGPNYTEYLPFLSLRLAARDAGRNPRRTEAL